MSAKKKATPATPATPVIKIANCDEADRKGLELGRARLEREALQNEISQEKTAIDHKFAARIEALAKTELELQLALDAFAAKHEKAESLNYIDIVSSGGGLAVIFEDEADVIKRLKRSDVWKHLVKATESVSKRDLAKIPAKLHKRFGFTYGPTNVTYSVKPKLDQVRIYAERHPTAKR